MFGIEVPVGKLVAPAVGAALSHGAKAAFQHMQLRRKGLTRTEKRMIEAFDPAELEKSLSLLSYYYELPLGVSLRDIETGIGSPDVIAPVKELMAACIAGLPASTIEDIEKIFVTRFASRFPPANKSELEIIASSIFDKLTEACRIIVGKLEELDPDAFNKLRQSAQFYAMLSTLQSIERHIKSEHIWRQDIHTRERYAEWEANYRAVVTEAHYYLQPPDFERKRKIPFPELYVSPSFSDTQTGADGPERFSLTSLTSDIARTVILGDPGGGKSTVSNYITYQAAAKQLGDYVPFLVILRNLTLDSSRDESILDHIEGWMNSHYQTPAPQGCIESILLSGRAIVILDGLDELLDVSRRREVTDRVEMFAQRYPLSRLLVTSRRIGYSQAQLDPLIFKSYELSEFAKGDVEEYARKWFAISESLSPEQATKMASSFIAESASVPDLRRNPLMLSLICIIYRGENFIPKNRPAVYEKCANLLFEKWDSSRKIHVELRAADYVDAAMKHLAYWMLNSQKETEGVEESELIDECTRMLLKNFQSEHEARHAATEFIAFCKGRAWVFSDAGSTADGESLYKFTHRTFMEYFAAYHLTRINDTPEALGRTLLPRISNQEWDEVAQLAVQIFDKSREDGGERVFAYFLNDRRKRSVERRDSIQSFIVRCMAFIPVSHDFARRLVSQVVEVLTASAREVEDAFQIRHPIQFPIGGILGLPQVREDAVPAVQEQLDRAIDKLLDGDEAQARVARFFISEFMTVYSMFALDVNDPLPIRRSWHNWAKHLHERYRSEFSNPSRGTFNYWILGEQNGFVTFEEYQNAISCMDNDLLPFDPIFVASLSEFLPMSFGSIANLLIFDMMASEPRKTSRLDAMVKTLNDHPDPPFASFSRWHVMHAAMPNPKHDLNCVPAKYRWLAVAVLLTSWERHENNSEESSALLKRYPEVIQQLVDARRNCNYGDGLATTVSDFLNDASHVSLLQRWVTRELDFAVIPTVNPSDSAAS